MGGACLAAFSEIDSNEFFTPAFGAIDCFSENQILLVIYSSDGCVKCFIIHHSMDYESLS